ncbi:tRNA lysidine(34) synthetase TilS [Aurantimonas sp. Leaf443]|uniref:tRNA lysidine(34) synthetase TilS n=1 Tax=Aurantimonas sp. Leaf443 TaxID=1736378 RepID=UPI0006FF4C23|nr:tRNA lysidine(34) synthetase TilS [Aurantimonas sp. Leaf443]KQT88150.1 hypothetical protein ASG48_01510 [Aurantimonas sp. Leaf443]
MGAAPPGAGRVADRVIDAFEGMPRPWRAVLGLSGGPDSLALLLNLVEARDRLADRGLDVSCVTVDHGLRAASAEEARFCADLCRRLAVPHETLVWSGHGPGNPSAAARAARYRLLAAAARRRGAGAILTAHHRDDQIETHILARERGAGPRGLAAMRRKRALAPDLVLLRPLLDLDGAGLKADLAARGQVAVVDPTNEAADAARIRIRRALRADPAARTEALAALDAAGAARLSLDRRLAGAIATLVGAGRLRTRHDGVQLLDRRALACLEDDIAFDLVSRLIAGAAGRGGPSPGAPTLRLRRALGAESFAGATLQGAALRDLPHDIVAFEREFGRAGPAAVDLAAGDGPCVTFDGRFEIDRDGPLAQGARTIEAFGRGGPAARTLPVARDAAGAVVAGHPALARRFGPAMPALSLRALAVWHLTRDLSDS